MSDLILGPGSWEVGRMIDILAEMFSYAFLVRAVIVGLLVSLCAALLGLSLVLKRYSMIGTDSPMWGSELWP